MAFEKVQITGRIGREVGSVGQYHTPALGKSAETLTKDFMLQLALEGRLFHTQQGDAGTLVDFAEVAYDEDQPQFALRVPSGTVVIPISIVYTMQDQAGTDNHVIISTTTNDIGNGTSTAATISPLRTDAPRNSQCVARSLYTANATAATGLIEIARFVDPFAAASTAPRPRYEWNAFQSLVLPVLVGPATLQTHVFATTDGPEGFSEIVWAELDKLDAID